MSDPLLQEGVLTATSIVDKRLQINEKRQLVVLQGTPAYTVFQQAATSQTATNNITWSIQPPIGNVIDPRLLITFSFSLAFTALTNDVGPQLNDIGNTEACRVLPIHSVIDTINLIINGTTFTYNPAETVGQLVHYIGDRDRQKEFSGTGILPDQFQDYRTGPLTFGFERNPLGPYGGNSYNTPPRGSITYVVTPAADGKDNSSVVTFTVTEPIMVSPAIFTQAVTQPGFVGIQNFQINIKTGNLQRCWSRALTGTRALGASSPVVTFSAAPNLTYLCMSLNPTLAAYNPLAHYYYPYFSVTNQPWAGKLNWSADLTVSASTDNIQGGAQVLSFIPTRMYLFVRQRASDRTFQTSDTCFRINSVSITMGNVVGILSSANSFDLYQISASNGLNMTWQQWKQQMGSVLCLQFGKDLPLDPSLAVGMLNNFQFTASVNCTNITGQVCNPELCYCWITPGMIDIHGTKCDSTSNLVSAEQVIASRANPFSHSLSAYDESLPFGGSAMMGGGFFGNLWSGIKGMGRKLAHAAPLAANLAASLGHGNIANALGSVGQYSNAFNQVANAMSGPPGGYQGSGLVYGGGLTAPDDKKYAEHQNDNDATFDSRDSSVNGDSMFPPGFFETNSYNNVTNQRNHVLPAAPATLLAQTRQSLGIDVIVERETKLHNMYDSLNADFQAGRMDEKEFDDAVGWLEYEMYKCTKQKERVQDPSTQQARKRHQYEMSTDDSDTSCSSSSFSSNNALIPYHSN